MIITNRPYSALALALAILVVVGLSLATIDPTSAQTDPPQRSAATSQDAHVPGEVLVRFKPGVSDTLANSLAIARGNTILSSSERPGTKRIAVNGDVAEAVSAYAQHPWVEFAQPNHLSWPLPLVPNDPFYDDGNLLDLGGQEASANANDFQRWYLGPDLLNAEAAWSQSTGNASVVVAIIDSGIDLDHPDLAPNIWTNSGEIPDNGTDDDANGFMDDVNGWDFLSYDNDPNPDLGNGLDDDDNGSADGNVSHGTSVAGMAGAVGNDAAGIAGAAWSATLMPLKVFTDDGPTYTFTIIEAINYAVANGAAVINLSLGATNALACPGISPAYETAITNAFNAGVVVIAAAGNSNTADPGTPASCTHAISVGASEHGSAFWQDLGIPGDSDGRAPFSNFGPFVDVVATGGLVTSDHVTSVAEQNLGSGTAGQAGIKRGLDGTSFAAPLVAGQAALILSRAQDLGVAMTPAQVRDIIESTATDLPDDPGDSPNGGANWDGNGLVNFGASLNSVNALAPTPTPVPTFTPTPVPTATPTPTATATPTPVAVPIGGGWALASLALGFGAAMFWARRRYAI